MLLFLSRARRSTRHLESRLWIFTSGAIVGMVGIYADERWLTMGAVGILAVGLVLRVLSERRGSEEGGGDDDEEEAGEDGGRAE